MSRAEIEAGEQGVAVRGEMSLQTVGRLLNAFPVKKFSGHGALEIDLGEVTRADSAGLALLIEWMGLARRNGTEIRFLNMPEQMREIARVTEVKSLLP